MDEEKKEIFSSKKALTEDDLRKFCSFNNFSFHITDLSKLNNHGGNRHSFIFTGETKDAVNKGHDHHWLFLDGIAIFDSYGNPSSYNLPDPYYIIPNHPRQLQEYDSTVCGEYCCAFYYFIKKIYKEEDEDDHHLAEEFSDYFGFTKNRLQNDRIVYEWFNNGKPKEKPKEEPKKEHDDEESTDEGMETEARDEEPT